MKLNPKQSELLFRTIKPEEDDKRGDDNLTRELTVCRVWSVLKPAGTSCALDPKAPTKGPTSRAITLLRLVQPRGVNQCAWSTHGGAPWMAQLGTWTRWTASHTCRDKISKGSCKETKAYVLLKCPPLVLYCRYLRF